MFNAMNSSQKERIKWRYIGLVFILFELLLVFIGLIAHSNLFINENDPSNRKLLSVDLTPLTRKQEIMINHTVLGI